MLTEHAARHIEECNEKIATSRFEQLMSLYEDPVRATVHRVLEEFVEHAFQEFMGTRIGTVVERASDGKRIKDYRNGHRVVKQVHIPL